MRQPTIHVDSQVDVNDVRQQMGLSPTAPLQQQANGNTIITHRHSDRDYTCPVCMDEARFSVETNCGHVFCGQQYQFIFLFFSFFFSSSVSIRQWAYVRYRWSKELFSTGPGVFRRAK